MTPSFIATAGGLNVASGVLMLVYWFAYVAFMPYGELSTTLSILVLHPAWTAINVAGVAGAVAGLLALPGTWMVQADEMGRGGLVGFYVALLGSALLLGPMLWDTVLWLPLARHDPALLDFAGPIYTSAAFIPFFASAGLLWGFGFAGFAWATARAGVLPRRAAWLVGVGAPVFALGALTGSWQAAVRTVGLVAFCLGLIRLGAAMLHRPRSLPEE